MMALSEKKRMLTNPYMSHNGIELFQDENGRFLTKVEVKPLHHNPFGYVHGGLYYTMADIVAGATAREHGNTPVTLDSDFHYLSNVSSGTITARASIVRTGNTIAVIRVEITSDTGTLLVEGTFTYYYINN